MSLTLGEKLRAAREERGISISEVAEQTRISPLYIESIEKDDFKLLPGGIFNKGFVRSFAKYVGVDEQEALQDYARQTTVSDAGAMDEPRGYRPEVLTDDRSKSSMLPTIVFAGIILALMTAGILFLVRYIQNQPETPAANVSTSPAANSAVVANPTPGPADTGAVPTWETVKIEFKAVNEEISLGTTVDGRSSETLIKPEQPVVFEPKESLKLRYARTRAPFASLSINGKAITLPTEPENPKRTAIEFDINRSNLAQIWQAAAITFGSTPEVVANTAPAASPATTQATPPAQTSAPAANTTAAPASTPRPVAASTPQRPARPSPTPIIVGRPANGAAPRPSP
jgi:cytoskeletal protein RodZ